MGLTNRGSCGELHNKIFNIRQLTPLHNFQNNTEIYKNNLFMVNLYMQYRYI